MKTILGFSDDEERYLDELRGRYSDKAKCQDCGDTGTIETESGQQFCRCWRERAWYTKFRQADIPETYYPLEMVDWDPVANGDGAVLSPSDQRRKSQNKIFMEWYLKGLPLICASPPEKLRLRDMKNHVSLISNLRIIGNRRSGKTMLAALIAKKTIERGLTAKYYNWTEMVNTLSSFEYRAQQDEIAQDFREKNVIVIDDIRDYGIKHAHYKLQLDRLSQIRTSISKPIILTFSNDDYREADQGSAWESLIESCYTVRLPHSPVK